MTPAPLLNALPYHRMARYTGRHRWWRPVLGTVVVGGGWFAILLALIVVSYGAGTVAGYPESPDGGVDFGPVANLALELASVAVALPLVLLVVRWIGKRPAGTVSSVTGRLRVRWLGWCLLAAAPAVSLLVLLPLLLPGLETDAASAETFVGWRPFLTAMAVLAVIVPFQAAAEEYVFRGWLTQAAGAFVRSPWIAALPQSLLFATAHGWGTVWGFVDLAVFGLATGLLAARTGGLEAGIALHVLNNVLALSFGAAVVDGLSSDETSADAPWQGAVVAMFVTVVYTALVLWLARRRGPERIAPPPSLPAQPYAPGYGAPSPYGASGPYRERGPYGVPSTGGSSSPYDSPPPPDPPN
ncbi:CPBP family intramembrane glutamic endopeptidase [Streptomyces adelaidensis]|uniref:CPBP family intramembrane glutamic endopeptidase n=1 Tax=Streptomyces adelaidensis TaxID=2796465 RepID=UPI001F3714F4|nr:CPBP family intramembrane glutamic endopeptidase [Streptomyces adelaidensis]